MNQDYSNYTSEDHQVWSMLFTEQMKQLPPIATKAFVDGIDKCRFRADQIPKFSKVNKALDAATGWKIYVVPSLIDNKPFFKHLSNKEFPATTWLRTMSQLKYLEEPDMFHDVFGHIPLLSEQFFCDYLQGISEITLKHIDNPVVVEMMARLYWYTIEFGLIVENGQLKIYGAGILSSPGESLYSLSEKATHLAYDPVTIMDTPYIKDKYQAHYFVIDSYKQLFESLDQVSRIVERVAETGVDKNQTSSLCIQQKS